MVYCRSLSYFQSALRRRGLAVIVSFAPGLDGIEQLTIAGDAHEFVVAEMILGNMDLPMRPNIVESSN